MAQHLPELFAHVWHTFDDRPAQRVWRDGAWFTVSYRELAERAAAVSGALIDRVQPGDRVAIFARNTPEWSQADVGILGVGAVAVPIYQTSTGVQAAHVLADSGARGCFVGSAEELARVVEVWEELPQLEFVVVLDDDLTGAPGDRIVLAWSDFAETRTEEVAARQQAIGTDDLATIIYTSGTTGKPKGVMLSHGAFLAERSAVLADFPITERDSSLCFLPLSHCLERAWTYVVLTCGALNTYVPDAKTVADALVVAQPTMLVSVPKLYETVYRVAHEKAAASKVKKRIFDWALKVGRRAQQKGMWSSPLLRVQLRIADLLVLRNVRQAVGGQKTVMASGGAPLRQEVEEFFWSAGMLICQGYGMTEAAPLISMNTHSHFRFGSIGRVIPTGEVRIGDEGEIHYRGPNIMLGYWNNDEATAEVLVDGWLRTGDVGHVDDDGFIFITDRIKDLIVTIGGRNIAPAPLEGELMVDPLIEYAVVLGDNRPCLTAIVRPSLPGLESWARERKLEFVAPEDLVADPDVIAEMRRRATEVTRHLPGHERIQDIRVVLDDFTMENGLLTPTLKVRRREVEKRFAGLVEDMYAKVAQDRQSKS